VKVKENDMPGFSSPEFQAGVTPVSLVVVCVTVSLFVHITVSLTCTVMVMGEKARLIIETLESASGA
jgi:hypothetical protein